MTRFPSAALAATFIALAAGASACGNVQAKTPAPMPVLDMPPPPGRVIVPTVLPEPAPEPTPPVTAQTPTRSTAAPPATRPAERPAQPTPTPSPEPTPPPTNAPVLQTTPDTSGLEQKAQEKLMAAKKDLDKVAYKNLSADAKQQYDTAVQYIGQAQDAIKMKNFVFANQLAEKAAVLAGLLVKSQGRGLTSPTSS